ncbi:hypothetical protein VCHA53O466_40091 [Vibrio chagasii]|nr:hypothetical protein VCHA53O466_40091 [Vibrio chagasii]
MKIQPLSTDEILELLSAAKDDFLDVYSPDLTGLELAEAKSLANRYIAVHKYPSGGKFQPAMLIRVPLKGDRKNGTKTKLKLYRGNDSDLTIQAFIRNIREIRNEVFQEAYGVEFTPENLISVGLPLSRAESGQD